MIVRRRRVNQDPIKLGSKAKEVVGEAVDTIVATAGIVTDTVIATRGVIELLHNSIEEANVESRADVAIAIQTSLNRLISIGMSEEDARTYLQCNDAPIKAREQVAYVEPVPVRTSGE